MDKAFALAIFILGDPLLAEEAVLEALLALDTSDLSQVKQLKNPPRGRWGKSENGNKIRLPPARDHVRLQELQMLQKLVFIKTESFELHSEMSAKLDSIFLVRRYVKHLLKEAWRRGTSFQFTTAISMVLWDYQDKIAQSIFDSLHAKNERRDQEYEGRRKDTSQYRRAKSILLKSLSRRFEAFIPGDKELQLVAMRDCRLAQLVPLSLETFTWWEPPCPWLQKNASQIELAEFQVRKEDPDDEHLLEALRIHLLLHPYCFSMLMEHLGFQSLMRRLHLPDFILASDCNKDRDDDKPPALLPTNEARQRLHDKLKNAAQRRQKAPTESLRLWVDGEWRGRLELHQARQDSYFVSDPLPALIQVYTHDSAGEVLLAACLPNYDETTDAARAEVFTFRLTRGRRIQLELTPRGSGLMIALAYRETRPWRALAWWWRRWRRRVAEEMPDPTPELEKTGAPVFDRAAPVSEMATRRWLTTVLAVALVLLTIGLWRSWWKSPEQPSLTARPGATPEALASPTPALTGSPASGQATPLPSPLASPRAAETLLAVLRSRPPQPFTPDPVRITRQTPKSLAEVKQVALELSEVEPLRRTLANELKRALARAGSLVIAEQETETTDATLWVTYTSAAQPAAPQMKLTFRLISGSAELWGAEVSVALRSGAPTRTVSVERMAQKAGETAAQALLRDLQRARQAKPRQ